MQTHYAAGLCALVLTIGGSTFATEPFAFEEVSAATGLKTHLEGDGKTRPWRYAHGAAWGDVDDDGRPDLFLGAFAARPYFDGADAPIPNRLFLNKAGLAPVEDDTLTARAGNARCAGAAFLDLDGDRDLDLVVTNHVTKDQGGSRVYENLGAGKFRDVTPDGAPWNAPVGMRNVAGIDLNDDGKLDLVLTDGSYGKNAATTSRLRVLKNGGKFQFSDVTADYGFPLDKTPGLGLGLGDMNNDGRIDLFVAGSNRLFVSQASGKYREVENAALQYPLLDPREGLRCGAAMADLDGDDQLDLVVTEHGVPTRLHVFRNTGIREGIPQLEDVSDAIGLGATFPSGTKEHPIKTAHVALRDIDNDSHIDVLLAVITKDAKGNFQPVALRNLAPSRGKPLKFSPPPFDAMYSYYAPGPVADFDRDGRVDFFLPSWFEDVPNLLFKNTTPGGHWLTVQVRGTGQEHNTQGIGAVVRAYTAGHVGEAQHLIARGDIVVGSGYASGEEALAHLGLGHHEQVDLRISWGRDHVDHRGANADRLLPVDFPAR